MAKTLLLNVLLKILGEYIELNEENLSLGVWSGQILLSNLNLKTEKILHDLNLDVKHGIIQKLEVNIPWATLLHNPIRIIISGIFLDVGPLDITKMNKTEILKRYLTEKYQKLKMIDQYFELSYKLDGADKQKIPTSTTANDDSSGAIAASNDSSESYIQQWVTKIVDNIEITLSNLHVRYEDSLSIPGKIFAGGITLESFGIATNNDKLNTSSYNVINSNNNIASKPDSSSSATHKIAYLKGLGIYWQDDLQVHQRLAGLPLKAWEKEMLDFMNKSAVIAEKRYNATSSVLSNNNHHSHNININPEDDNLMHILSPYNSNLTLRMKQNKKPTSILPKYEICAVSGKLQTYIDSVQYVQVISVMDRMAAFDRLCEPPTYRPKNRPCYSSESCRAWWKYACKLALKMKLYIKLMKQARISAAGNDDPIAYLSPSSALIIKELEIKLPFECLSIGRQQAILEIHEEAKLKESKQLKGGGWTWGSWLGGTSTTIPIINNEDSSETIETSSDISIESILGELNKRDNGTGINGSKLALISFSLESSASLILSNKNKPILKTSAALSVSFFQSNTSLKVSCHLKDLYVRDEYTINPGLPYLISVKSEMDPILRRSKSPVPSGEQMQINNQESNTPTFSATYESETSSGKSKLSMASLPIELVLNKDCIQMLINSFERPENPYKVKVRSKSINPSRANSVNNLQTIKNDQQSFGLRSKDVIETAQLLNQIISNNQTTNHILEISLQAYAPKIIIPEYSVGDEGYLLIDCGFLVMKGFSSSAGISIDWSLQEVCVGMPLKIRDMYTFGEKSLYLIKPFDIIMQMQTIEQVHANITMNVEIKPEIRGEIDSIKLARLLRALGQLSQMVAKMPSSVPMVQTLFGDVMNEIISNKTNPGPALFVTPINPKSFSTNANRFESSELSDNIFRNIASTRKENIEGETPFKFIPSNGVSPSNSDEFFSPVKAFDGIDLDPIEFITPSHKSNSSTSDQKSHGKDRAQQNSKSPEQSVNDPYITTLKIDLFLPAIALDLTYNVANGYHLVFEINSMRATYSTRLYDKNIVFELGEICMQDSFRSIEQSYLMWTPKDCGSLVNISYVNVNSKLSPLYKEHATYIVANFAFLNLNVDVNTINHLRPFFEVLLTPSSPSPNSNENYHNNDNIINKQESHINHKVLNTFEVATTTSSKGGISSYPSSSNLINKDVPEGMHLIATLERISLDLLRAPHPKQERKGEQLESAFSAQISGMQFELFTLNLMKATVCLRSFEILDIRNVSQDYAFQKVFCPQVHDNIIINGSPFPSFSSINQLKSIATKSSSKIFRMDSSHWSEEFVEEDFYDTCPGDDEDEYQDAIDGNEKHKVPTIPSSQPQLPLTEKVINLLEITYAQESKVHSLIEMAISDITSFIALDTILDFSNIFMINFFALLGLLAAPSPVINNTVNNINNIDSQVSSSRRNSEQPVYFATGNNDNPVIVNDTSKILEHSDESIKDEIKEITSTMNVLVKVINPRLIFLEDPTTLETKAIGGTCGVGMQYTRVSKTYISANTGKIIQNKTSLIESLHITVSKYEVFVIQNMSKWIPQPILEPMEIELHLKKRTEDNSTKLLSLHIEIDNFNAQVSFNDILLAQSIISRRVLIESATSTPVPSTTNATDLPQQPQQMSSRNEKDEFDSIDIENNKNNSKTDATMTFQFGLNTLTVIIINDFNSKNIPILKTNIKNSHFYIEEHTASSYVVGNGIFSSQIDFFNHHMSMWEPLLEVWQPSIRIYSIPDMNSKIFEIKSDCTLQITISGMLLETLLKSYSIFFHDQNNNFDDEKQNKERAGMSDIEAYNQLGSDIGIELYHCVTKKKLLTLQSGESGIINNNSSKGSYRKMNTLEDIPSSVDVYFLGTLSKERLPLFNVPLNTNKPKAYNLQPSSSSTVQVASTKDIPDSSSTNIIKANKTYVIEPIVEEVYENARYDPITGWWRPPFFLGDPPEWTDGSGTISKDISSIQIAATDQWEWQGKWEVDLDGVIGTEIDQEGWEYATSFKFFTLVNTRRTVKSMDSVRRRKWTRTRVPKASCISQIERPLTLFWDVQVLNNGSRKVDIRSSLQISNQLAFPILISLHHNAWNHEVKFGPIQVDEVFSIPLLYSYAYQICFCPDFPLYDWSTAFACSSQSYDFRSIKYASCNGIKESQSISVDTTTSRNDVKPIWFKVVTSQANKSVLVTLKSCIVIINKLLCDMQFICLTNKVKTEEGKINSGTKMKLSHIDLTKNPQLVIKVGHMKWSNPIPINTLKNEADVFELVLPGNKKAIKLYLSMNSKVNSKSGSAIEIEIFSKAAVIDRTGLHLYIASKLNPGIGLVRSTCTTLSISNNESSSTNESKNSTLAATLLPSFITQKIITLTTTTGLKQESLHPKTINNEISKNHMRKQIESISTSPTTSATGDDSNLPRITRSPSSKSIKNIVSEVGENLTNIAEHSGDKTTNLNTTNNLENSESLIHSVSVNSPNKYELCYSAIGDNVYTIDDKNHHVNNTLNEVKWFYLPTCFHKKLQLRTPTEDKLQRSNRLIKFITSTSCMVFVFIDIRVIQLKWLKTDGYIKIMEIASARGLYKGQIEEYHYAIYGKCYEANSQVLLKGSWNKQAANMYTVFILSMLPSKITKDIHSSSKKKSNDDEIEDDHDDDALISKDMIYRQLTFEDSYSRDISARSWTEGANQLSFLYTYDNVITVGLCRGKVWSEEIDIDIQKNTSSTGSFEVQHIESQICYQLSYKLEPLPGLYSDTQLITFIPRYCVLNCTKELLLLSQRGSEKYLQYQPYQPEGWHKLEIHSGTEVQIRTESSMWSLGAIDINEIGSSVLYLPYRHKGGENESSVQRNGVVLRIEVKLADAQDQCNIIVIVWEESIESNSGVSMSICNHSDVTITIRQADIEIEHDITGQEHLFEVVVPSGCSVPFGWSDPAVSTEVLVTVGVDLQGPNKRIASIDMKKTDQLLRLPYQQQQLQQANNSRTSISTASMSSSSSRGEVVLATKMSNHGHMLEITNMSKSIFAFSNEGIETTTKTYKEIELNALKNKDSKVPSYGFDFLLSSFGVSLVVEQPSRREILSLYVDLFEISVRMQGNLRSLEVMVMDLQVDNYSETAIYPVLLRSTKKQIHQSVTFEGENISDSVKSTILEQQQQPQQYNTKSSKKSTKDIKPEVPFIKLTIVQETQKNGLPPVFKYIAFRILSLAVEVDSSTVYLFFVDLLNGLKVLNQSQALAISFPDQWLDDFNKLQLYPQQQLRLINVYQSKIQAQQSKLYFQYLIIHPIKVTFTLTQTTHTRMKRKKVLHSTVLNQLERLSLVGVEKLQIRLNSFQVDDAMESMNSLIIFIINRTKSDLQSQLAQIAGSITMIGSPIGFVRKVGSGVKSFFYEPYLGSVHSSQEFVIGLGRGTKNLLSSVVTGAMDSTAAIVGTATKGMYYISGDHEYVRKRAVKRQERLAGRGGFLDGVIDGTDSLLSGISSGVTGLISKPIEEASKSGVHGFFKGLGLGLIGVAVKPMIGFSDGIASVAQGISNEVDTHIKSTHVRPPRALQPSALDLSCLVIVPLNMDAAFAQEFVVNRAKRGHYEDSFLCYIPLEKDGREAIILSSVYLYWRRSQSLWGRIWANISHCVYLYESNSIGVMLYTGGLTTDNGNAAYFVTIPCQSRNIARKVYQALVANKARMGNPSNVISLDTIDAFYNNINNTSNNTNNSNNTNTNSSQQELLLFRKVMDVSLLGTIDGYHFGNTNKQKLKPITGSEYDVLKRAQYNLEKAAIRSWKELDHNIWQLIWEWGCVNPTSRCCVTVIINRSDSPIQITRVQMVFGKNAQIFGSTNTGYEVESRSLLPDGVIVIFISAFPESSLQLIDSHHLKANINTAAFSAVLASTQRETFCEAKGGFTVGFLEKTATETSWWCKYVIIVS